MCWAKILIFHSIGAIGVFPTQGLITGLPWLARDGIVTERNTGSLAKITAIEGTAPRTNNCRSCRGLENIAGHRFLLQMRFAPVTYRKLFLPWRGLASADISLARLTVCNEPWHCHPAPMHPTHLIHRRGPPGRLHAGRISTASDGVGLRVYVIFANMR